MVGTGVRCAIDDGVAEECSFAGAWALVLAIQNPPPPILPIQNQQPRPHRTGGHRHPDCPLVLASARSCRPVSDASACCLQPHAHGPCTPQLRRSVFHALHCTRPVLVVPSRLLCRRRAMAQLCRTTNCREQLTHSPQRIVAHTTCCHSKGRTNPLGSA